MADLEKKYEACVVSGVEGASLYLNNYRIAGPKPWGGGQTAYEWSRVTMDDLVQAVPELRALRESHDALEKALRKFFPIGEAFGEAFMAATEEEKAAALADAIGETDG